MASRRSAKKLFALTLLSSPQTLCRVACPCNPADDTAIQWIASEFAKAGLEPAGNGSYFQLVPPDEYRPDRSQNFVSLHRGTADTQVEVP